MEPGLVCTINCDDREIAGIALKFYPTIEKLSCVLFESGPRLYPDFDQVKCLDEDQYRLYTFYELNKPCI